MRRWPWLAVAAVGAVTASCSAANDAGPAVSVDPAALYNQMCARCHGADGRGDPTIRQQMPVRDLTDPQFRQQVSIQEMERVIMTGRNQMPAFGKMLSMPKIQAVAGYVRRLGAQ